MSQYGGIDIGKHKSFACRIDLAKKEVKFPESSFSNDAILGWFKTNPVKSICIDGPPQPNQGLLRDQLPPGSKYDWKRRLAEFRLLIYGCYGTPDRKPADNWMANSMNLFGLLRDAFKWSIDFGDGKGELLETHPTYAFKSLLEFMNGDQHGDIQQIIVDPQRLLGPKRPRNAGGHDQRIELLIQCFAQLGFDIPQSVQQQWESSIDYVDATMCALIALWRDEKRNSVLAVGDPKEGSIYIAQPTQTLTVTPVAAGVRPLARPAKHTKARLNIAPPNAMIMRLGANGPGGLTQSETIALAITAFGEGDSWLPVGTGHKSKLSENLEAAGNQLYLAFGETLRLRITTGQVNFQPGSEVAYPGDFNPWPVDTCAGWVEMLDVTPVAITAFETRQSEQWQPSFSKRGHNLLAARVAE